MTSNYEKILVLVQRDNERIDWKHMWRALNYYIVAKSNSRTLLTVGARKSEYNEINKTKNTRALALNL